MEKIELEDIQGLVIKGYSELPAADYVILEITDKIKAKAWILSHLQEFTTAATKPTETAQNIAFTFDGLKALGLNDQTMDSFPMELEDGMITRHKQDYLGDYGSSDPSTWEWGGKNNPKVHAVVLLYAATEDKMNAHFDAQKNSLEANGFRVLRKLDTTILPLRKEHFGFQDGIAQPTIKGLSRADSPENTVAVGEFILGYKNEYDQYAVSPTVAEELDASGLLSISPRETSKKDLGKNGSFMVFRQYKQYVEEFWKYMDDATTVENDPSKNEKEMIKLASKMVGRWPSGAPIAVTPDHDDPSKADLDAFGYRDTDGEGLKCPFASHIRRTNPRDSQDTSRNVSIATSNKHRILRRGRAYGEPISKTMDPEEILRATNVQGERGLHFICFNADIARQFEFIQNAWVNNPKFNGLHDERDPITGNHSHPLNEKLTGTFSVPQEIGLRDRYTKIPEFVQVMGGAYFFMPGVKALRYLALV